MRKRYRKTLILHRIAGRNVRHDPLISARPLPVVSRQGNRVTVLRAPLAGSTVVYTPVNYYFGDLTAKWSFSMLTERVSSLNKARVDIAVSADSRGLPYNPTSATAEMAFLASPYTKPVAGDWKAATWDVTRIGSYVMQCLVGPGGTVSLAVGGYYVWARITDSVAGEQPVEQVARLFVD